MDTILSLFEITFSISASLSTNNFPVEEPANNLTPQHPSTSLSLDNCFYIVRSSSKVKSIIAMHSIFC